MCFFWGNIFVLAFHSVGCEKLCLSINHRIWFLFYPSFCRNRFLLLGANQKLICWVLWLNWSQKVILQIVCKIFHTSILFFYSFLGSALYARKLINSLAPAIIGLLCYANPITYLRNIIPLSFNTSASSK